MFPRQRGVVRIIRSVLHLDASAYLRTQFSTVGSASGRHDRSSMVPQCKPAACTAVLVPRILVARIFRVYR